MGWGGYGRGYGRGYGGYGEYVSTGQKLANGQSAAAALATKQKREPQPVELKSKKIATTFWGKAWCDNLESYSDYSNRLPRGATYVRNGSVTDLIIKSKRVEAIVAGSEPYTVTIDVSPLSAKDWQAIKLDCSKEIDSLLDLLAGKLSDGVMKRLTKQRAGLFPQPKEIKLRCSCPDGAYVCKHVAAVMYGIGSRLDSQPDLLFTLRDVDHKELVTQAVAEGNLDRELNTENSSLAGEDLGAMFGIELDISAPSVAIEPPRSKSKKAAQPKKAALAKKAATPAKAAVKKTTAKKAASKKVAVAKTTTTEATGPKTAAKKAASKKTAAKKAVTKATTKKAAKKKQ